MQPEIRPGRASAGTTSRALAEMEKNNLPTDVTVPRTLVCHQEPIQSIALHAFGDTSGNGVSAAVYAVVTQESGTNQGLMTAKS